MRHTGTYGPLHETQRQVDEQQNSPAAHQPNYGALRDTQHQVDEQRDRPVAEPPASEPQRPEIRRSWTHHGGMVQQQDSANTWLEQNAEIRKGQANKAGGERGGEAKSGRDQNDPELQEARAAIEDARRREAERARQQERERSGPER